MASAYFHAQWRVGTEAERGAFSTTSLKTPFFWYESDTGDLWYWQGSAWRQWAVQAWKPFEVTPEVIKLPAANAPAEANKDGFAMLRFDRATEESVYWLWTVPTDFATGAGSVKGFFKFLVENPPSGTGNEAVVMGFEYKKISDGAVFDFDAGTSSGSITETITDGETAEIIHHTSEGTCTTTGWAADDTILFRFFRDATNPSDTYDNEASAPDNDVWLFEFCGFYLSNKLGEPE